MNSSVPERVSDYSHYIRHAQENVPPLLTFNLFEKEMNSMDKHLLEYSIDELAHGRFSCSCGKEHYIGIEHIAIGKGAVERLPE